MNMNRRAHQLGNLNNALECGCFVFVGKNNLLGTDTHRNVSCRSSHPRLSQKICRFRREIKGHMLGLNMELIAHTHKMRIKEVHLRHTDKAGNKEIGRTIENILWGTNLLYVSIPHNNNTVTQRHSLCLIVCNVNERTVNFLAQLNKLGTHLITQLCVQV